MRALKLGSYSPHPSPLPEGERSEGAGIIRDSLWFTASAFCPVKLICLMVNLETFFQLILWCRDQSFPVG